MPFHKQIFIMLLAIILPITVFFLLKNYFHEQELLLDAIDARLLTSARLARHIIGVNYHDTLVNADSIDEETYVKMIERYNRFCLENELQYLMKLILK